MSKIAHIEHNVELASVSEVDNLVKKSNDLYDKTLVKIEKFEEQFKKFNNEIGAAGAELEMVNKDLINAYSDIEKKVKDLGIPMPQDLSKKASDALKNVIYPSNYGNLFAVSKK